MCEIIFHNKIKFLVHHQAYETTDNGLRSGLEILRRWEVSLDGKAQVLGDKAYVASLGKSWTTGALQRDVC